MKITTELLAITLLLCACSGGNTVPASKGAAAAQHSMVDAAGSQPPRILIPRSIPGDKGQYYLLEMSKSGNIVSATHERVGVDSIGFTRTETNCSTMQMREIGYSETSPAAIEDQPTDWFDLVPGSSKADLAAFVCN